MCTARLRRYLALTGKAIRAVEVLPPEGSLLRKVAEDLLDMARRYYEDALYYADRDCETALVAVVYAHAWLDVGARLGLFKGGDPNILMVEA